MYTKDVVCFRPLFLSLCRWFDCLLGDRLSHPAQPGKNPVKRGNLIKTHLVDLRPPSCTPSIPLPLLSLPPLFVIIYLYSFFFLFIPAASIASPSPPAPTGRTPSTPDRERRVIKIEMNGQRADLHTHAWHGDAKTASIFPIFCPFLYSFVVVLSRYQRVFHSEPRPIKFLAMSPDTLLLNWMFNFT